MRISGILLAISGLVMAENSLKDALAQKGQEFKFETEVNQVMEIIIHSLYKTKDVFMRELISNSADALDKIRLASLTDKAQLETNPDLKISVSVNKEDRTLTIRDTGIGMTQEQLRANLGTIAKSGTREFLNAIKENGANDPGLIGKFGVGFYSAFLVADSVVVVSKHNDDDQAIWQASSQSSFKIMKDPRGNTLGRGTEIVLHLREDADEFMDTDRLKSIIKKNSEFVNFPVYLWTTKTVEVPVDEPSEDASVETDDEAEVEDVTGESEGESTAPKTTTETVSDWELVNESKPIWTKDPSEVTEEEYHDFFKSHYKAHADPLAYTRFKLEGEAKFTGMLFIPSTQPRDLLNPNVPSPKTTELFVRRVFISDEFPDFFPKWFAVFRIIIDSDDLPINVSRETIQTHASLKLVRNKIISKGLDMLLEMAKNETKYKRFYAENKQALTLGVYEAKSTHQKKLTKLLRFPSTDKEWTSLAEYVDRMKEKQPQIYYSIAMSVKAAKASPFAEKLIARGYEVLIFSDPVEEYLANEKMREFQGLPLQNVAKPGLLYGDEDDSSKDEEAQVREKFAPLTEWFQTELEKHVAEVGISLQLTKSAMVVVPHGAGITATQSRMMSMQYVGKEKDYMYKYYMDQKRAIQINPKHPIMEKLLEKVVAEDLESVKDFPKALYEIYSIGSGWEVTSPNRLVTRLERVVKSQLGLDREAEPEVKVAPAPDVKPKKQVDDEPSKSDEAEDEDGHEEL